jgi:DNA-binding GntR family transcriptional regulator
LNFAIAGREKMTGSSLHSELARRIRRHLVDSGAATGQRLVEEDLCRIFDVSRTPVRGALKLLAQEGVVAPRPGRGYVLAAPPKAAGHTPDNQDSEEARLFEAIADARKRGELPDHVTQQEILRRFGVRASIATKVLMRLNDLGLLERRAGHGWTFTGESGRALQESYAFRRALEPALLLLPGFRLDRAWAGKSRAAHLALRRKPWGPGDGEAFHALNADFHEQLGRCCGNRHMRQAVEKQIALRRFLSRRWNYPVEQIHSAIDEHLEILAALEQGYADKASALMLHHLTKSATTNATTTNGNTGAGGTKSREAGIDEAVSGTRKERNAG